MALVLTWLAAFAGATASACQTPCESTDECAADQGCRDGFCVHECNFDRECPVGQDCDGHGLCVLAGAGAITWLGPAPDSDVDTSFDAAVEVTFRAPTATLRVDRYVPDAGDPCAPFIPVELVLLGDQQNLLTQTITLPRLFALGPQFTLNATLETPTGIRNQLVPLHGPPSGYGGARITSPLEGRLDADVALTVGVDATLDVAGPTSITVEPIGGAVSVTEPFGIASALEDARARVPRGPHVIWVDSATGRCGRGLVGVGAPPDGVELGLSWSGDERGQVDLQLLIDGAQVCDFRAPGASCQAIRESTAPALRGEEVLHVPELVGDGVVEVAVVPGAVGAPLLSEVRVSFNGVHVGWLGPRAVRTDLGMSWIAGRVVVTRGIAELQQVDDETYGAPW